MTNDVTDPQDAPPTMAVPGLLLAVLLYAIPLGAALRPVGDWDLWWHLRTGEWVVQHGAVPTVDPFAAPGEGRPWVAYSWLFGVLVHAAHAGLGLHGVLLLRVGLVLAVTAALHRLAGRREPNRVRAAGLALAAVIALLPLFSERSWLFSILFSTLTLDAILTLRAGRPGRAVWLLPLAYVAWASLHIQFACGLLLLGLACAAPWVDRVLGGEPPDAASWRRLVGLTAACTAATLLNPYGPELYALVLALPTQAGAFAVIGELQAMPFRELPDWLVLGLAGAAAAALGRRGGRSSFEPLLLLLTAYLSFRARRDVWLVVLAAVAVLATRPGPAVPVAPGRGPGLLVALLVTLLVVGLAWQRDLTAARLEADVAARYPAAAAAFVAERGGPGPLFNDFNWGGYLLWRLPAYPVAIDGRAHLHGDDRLLRSARTWAAGPGWDADPDLAAARLVVAPLAAPLVALLRRDGRFAVVYEDAVAVVFRRAS